MVDINELYITPDNKRMIIDVSIKKKSYYKDVYLDEVVIDTQDTFIENIGSPSPEWILKRKISGEDYIAKVAWETGKVDEYMDLICTLHHCGCHSHCGDNHCGCHHEHNCCHDNCCNNDCCHDNCHNHCHDHCHDVCHCRTGETGHYANPYSVKAIDLDNKLAIDPNGIEFSLDEGAFYKFVIEDKPEDENNTEESNEDIENSTEESNLTIKENGDIYMYNGKDLTLYIKDIIPLKVKHARIELRQEDLRRPLSDTMFFVWVKTKGVPTPDCPCGGDSQWSLGVCINRFTIYRRFMCLMRELLNTCDIPKDFIDLYLRWKSVEMSIKLGHYNEAILYWKRFFLFKHQRPLWESPQYIQDWIRFHNNPLLPQSNYGHQSYGWGGNLSIGGCKRCNR